MSKSGTNSNLPIKDQLSNKTIHFNSLVGVQTLVKKVTETEGASAAENIINELRSFISDSSLKGDISYNNICAFLAIVAAERSDLGMLQEALNHIKIDFVISNSKVKVGTKITLKDKLYETALSKKELASDIIEYLIKTEATAKSTSVLSVAINTCAKVLLEKSKSSNEVKQNLTQTLLNIIKKLVQSEDVNAIDNEGNTPLLIATKKNNEFSEEVVKLLLENKADPNLANKKNELPIIIATSNNNLNMLKSLLDYKADINAISYDNTIGKNSTALISAVKNFKTEAVELLLNYSANPNLAAADGESPLTVVFDYLSTNSGTKIFELLLSHNAHLSKDLFNKFLTLPNDHREALSANKTTASALLPGLFQKEHFDLISKMIFSNLELEETETYEGNLTLSKPKSVIYNNDSYSSKVYNKDYIKGKELVLAEGNIPPIGYNIYLPEGIIKSVLVNVYGGGKTNDKDLVYCPEDLADLDKNLLKNGIAIVKLNLIDLKELNVYQGEMPEELHKKLLKSINHFYQVIKNNPESLSDSLAGLKGLKIFLMGSSFGGQLVERYAEEHPDTYDGYISFDGGLSTEILGRSDGELIINNRADEDLIKAALYLDPQNQKTNSTTPHLIIHNLNDNNVNTIVSIDYAKEAIKAGKKIQVLFNNKGGNDQDISNLENSGHFYPRNKTELENMVSRVVNFMNGNLESELLTDWRLHEAKLYTDWNYKSASLQQKFISAAYRIYQNTEGADGIIDRFNNKFGDQQATKAKLSEQYYKPLYLTLVHLDNIKNDDTLWDKQIAYSQTFSDEVLTNAIKYSFHDVLEFVSIGYGLLFEDVQNKQFMLSQYRTWLEDNSASKGLKLYLLKNIYLANPGLINDEYFDDFRNDPDIISAYEESKTELVNQFAQIEREALDVWRDELKKIVTDSITYDPIASPGTMNEDMVHHLGDVEIID